MNLPFRSCSSKVKSESFPSTPTKNHAESKSTSGFSVKNCRRQPDFGWQPALAGLFFTGNPDVLPFSQDFLGWGKTGKNRNRVLKALRASSEPLDEVWYIKDTFTTLRGKKTALESILESYLNTTFHKSDLNRDFQTTENTLKFLESSQKHIQRFFVPLMSFLSWNLNTPT